MNYIYLIGTSGAAKTGHEYMARALEQVSDYHRCTQEEYLQRMREMRALDLSPQPTETDHTNGDQNDPTCDMCPICGTPMDWEDCDVCGGMGHLDVYELDPLWYNPGSIKMCKLCHGNGGWYTCLNYRNHPTETDRTASDPASTTPAGTPATPLAGRQQHRQQKEAL